MIYLILSILSSTAIFVLFKSFDRFKINTFQAIVTNYLTAACCGFVFYNQPVNLESLIHSTWFAPAGVLGVLFIMMFYLMALTAQKNGLSVASVASKMSVIVPVIFGILVFNESFGALKIIGVLIALVAVYLTSIKNNTSQDLNKSSILLPFLVFIGSGVVDTSINYFAPDDAIPVFSATIFAMAALIGILIVSVQFLSSNKKIQSKAIPLGIALGMVNYGSIYFLLKALRVEGTETSSIFTINNVAIVALSTLVGLVIYKERIDLKNWLGIGLAFISIILVSQT